MTAITLTVTVELNDDLTEAEASTLTSDLVFGLSNSAKKEINGSLLAAARRNHGGLTAAVNVKVVEEADEDEESPYEKAKRHAVQGMADFLTSAS